MIVHLVKNHPAMFLCCDVLLTHPNKKKNRQKCTPNQIVVLDYVILQILSKLQQTYMSK